MEEELKALRKTVLLKIPQTQYALISELMEKGKTLSISYEENDVLLEVEIPTRLEHKVEPFFYTPE